METNVSFKSLILILFLLMKMFQTKSKIMEHLVVSFFFNGDLVMSQIYKNVPDSALKYKLFINLNL